MGNLLNILYIEDDECDVELLTLSIEGYEPTLNTALDVALSFEEAKSLLQNNKYDIILTDWNIPGSEGPDVIRYIRETDETVAIIIVSGLLTDLHFNLAKKYSAVSCLEKNYNDAFIDQILKVISA